MGLRGSEQPGPPVIGSHGKGVYVTGCARPTEDRRRDAADDHRKDIGRFQPLREIGSGWFLLTALAPERTIVMGPRPSGDRLNLLEESL